jgi:hypothetical protein
MSSRGGRTLQFRERGRRRVVGGEHGLRLTSIDTGETIAEPYLLLSLQSASD